jgi:hypothetical protein
MNLSQNKKEYDQNRRLRIVLLMLTILRGALDAAAASSIHTMNEDGICYIDRIATSNYYIKILPE